MIIGIDVDLTVVDSVTPWKEWYKKLTGHDISDEIDTTDYNLEKLMKMHNDPLAFWRKSDLYDNLEAYKDAVEYINVLKEEGHIILFVSSCMPEHEQSKRMFLQRNFNFDGFISTHDKQYVDMDFFIDDYDKNLNAVSNFRSDCKCFRIDSEVNRSAPTKFRNGNWKQFYDFIQENISDK